MLEQETVSFRMSNYGGISYSSQLMKCFNYHTHSLECGNS